MDDERCQHPDCDREWRFFLSDMEEDQGHYYCQQHFLLACAAYVFAAAVNHLPDKERLMAHYNGLYIAPEGAEIG